MLQRNLGLRRLALVTVVSILASCGPQPQEKAPPQGAQAGLGAALGFEPAPCPPLARALPAVGDTFVFRSLDSSGGETGGWTYRVVGVDGDVVKAETRMTLPNLGSHEGPKAAYAAGVIPATSDAGDAERRYEFPPNAPERVRALASGEKAVIPGSETSTLNGVTRTIEGELEVALVACGSLPVAGRREPVHVYDVVDFRRAVLPVNGKISESVRRNRVRSYVSDRFGWEIANQTDGGALAPVSLPDAGSPSAPRGS